MTIWTIGHSTRTLAEFIAVLRSQQIEVLADVRAMPGSRRYPLFNRHPLANALHAEGIAYERSCARRRSGGAAIAR
jgi:uncharacterized protein (DUF488 family)